MKRKSCRRLALVSIIVGILVLNLKSFLRMTGAVVGASSVVSRAGFWIGLIFVLTGFVLTFMARRPGAGDLVSRASSGVKIIPTRNFLKSLKGADLDKINNTLKKIGSDLKKKKILTTKSYSINAGTGKINFDYNPKKNVAKIQGYS